MFRFFTRKKPKNMPLGRWGAVVRNTKNDNKIYRETSIDFNSRWANHDHCGGDLCQNVSDFDVNDADVNDAHVNDSHEKDAHVNDSQVVDLKNKKFKYDDETINMLPYVM